MVQRARREAGWTIIQRPPNCDEMGELGLLVKTSHHKKGNGNINPVRPELNSLVEGDKSSTSKDPRRYDPCLLPLVPEILTNCKA
jgi:hypothetical protein